MATKKEAIEVIEKKMSGLLLDKFLVEMTAKNILSALENEIRMLPPEVFDTTWKRRANVWE